MLIQSGTNVVNEVVDVRKGIDTITSPRASHAVLKGRMTERGAYAFALGMFAVAIALGLYPRLPARPDHHRARDPGPDRRLRVHGAAVPVQVQGARRADHLRR